MKSVRGVRRPRTRRVAKLAKIEKAVHSILEAIGEDPDREGVRDTPHRVAQLYQRIFSGIGQDPTRDLRLYRVSNQDGMILIKDISFHSMCEHHLLPFFGKIHLAYLPSRNLVTGLSSLTKAVEVLSQRPQLQERLANEIADTLMKALKPKGLLVVVEAEHLCVAMNDAQKLGTSTISTAARGAMLEEPARAQALSLISSQTRTRTRK
jgi:GTP cyclohydrolase IA